VRLLDHVPVRGFDGSGMPHDPTHARTRHLALVWTRTHPIALRRALLMVLSLHSKASLYLTVPASDIR
jgi:hypothetical protein